jgi:hypothetical protein
MDIPCDVCLGPCRIDTSADQQQDYPLPEPYDDNTPQDHADALRDHADPRINCPVLDIAAMAAADLIEKQAAEIERLTNARPQVCITHEVVMAFIEAPDRPDDDITGPLAAAFRAAGIDVATEA